MACGKETREKCLLLELRRLEWLVSGSVEDGAIEGEIALGPTAAGDTAVCRLPVARLSGGRAAWGAELPNDVATLGTLVLGGTVADLAGLSLEISVRCPADAPGCRRVHLKLNPLCSAAPGHTVALHRRCERAGVAAKLLASAMEAPERLRQHTVSVLD